MVRRDRAMTGSGIVYLVGAGPGDPGLLTLRARELLRACDDVVHDALVSPEVLSSEWLERDIGPELHYAGKRGGETSTKQDDINALLIRLAGSGRRVVRLKGGDPFVFGRGSEEAQALAAAGIAFEIVPGVTAGIAAPAYAGIPVTHRGVATSVTFVTGHEDPAKGEMRTNWRALAQAGGTLVLYMSVGSLSRIVSELQAGGLPATTAAAVIEWGTYARQRTITATLATLVERATDEQVKAPSITVIGDVARLRDEIGWWERRPLHGRTVVVTRARAQASSLSAKLRALGAEVVEMPAIRIEPVDGASLRAALTRLTDYQWLILTSQNAVELCWGALRALAVDARALAGLKIVAVGPATAAALLAHGIATDVTPERYVAEGIADVLRDRDDVGSTRALYVRAEGARDVLPRALREMGADVDEVIAYRTVADASSGKETRARLLAGEVNAVTFTSASTVRFFVDAVGKDAAAAARAVSIGPATSAALRSVGLAVACEAREATIDALVEAVQEEVGG